MKHLGVSRKRVQGVFLVGVVLPMLTKRSVSLCCDNKCVTTRHCDVSLCIELFFSVFHEERVRKDFAVAQLLPISRCCLMTTGELLFLFCVTPYYTRNKMFWQSQIQYGPQ